jgi:hypothetical protein
MRVAVLSESPDDEASIRILLAALLGRETQEVSLSPLRSRGWPAVARILPAVLPHLHYRTDAEALVVIVDSDDSPIHQSDHVVTGALETGCRLCHLRNVVDSRKAALKPVPGRELIKTALGLAVPAIEAWYRCGLDPQVNESAWARKLASEKISYTRNSLKRDVYGTERPSIQVKTERAVDAAKRLASDIPLVESLFPAGFGAFVNDVRSW